MLALAPLTALILALAPALAPATAQDIAESARYASEASGTPLPLLMAVAEHESHFNPDAVSQTEDWGVWQLNPRTPWGKRAAAWCSHDPRDCIRAQALEAAFLLASNRRQCKDWKQALGAYNTGWCDSPTGERYARKVVRKVHRYRKLRR